MRKFLKFWQIFRCRGNYLWGSMLGLASCWISLNMLRESFPISAGGVVQFISENWIFHPFGRSGRCAVGCRKLAASFPDRTLKLGGGLRHDLPGRHLGIPPPLSDRPVSRLRAVSHRTPAIGSAKGRQGKTQGIAGGHRRDSLMEDLPFSRILAKLD